MEGDELCDVCRHGDSEPDNQILFCDGAGCCVTVHQQCYGVHSVPIGDWLCATCKAGLRPGTAACKLCGVVGGAMKSVASAAAAEKGGKGKTSGSRKHEWVHVVCATWIPETHFGLEENVDNVMVGWGEAGIFRCSHYVLGPPCLNPEHNS
jgi:hypothetical protein